MQVENAKIFFQKNHRLLFYAAWVFLALIQAALTELQDDEAYYWVYSKFLDWGYFDHPPMTGLLVKMGYAIFPNELGVRFFPLLLNFFSLILIEKLLAIKNPRLFYSIVLSIAVLQLSGFAAVPDIPLIFFTALFFWCYKNFLKNFSILHSMFLGLAIALLCYSKYHAVLIVLFTVFSNLSLFKKYQTYVAGLVALLLFAPHLWWQYNHDWVSIRYHLFESNVNDYKPSFTINYILSQLLLPGPIAGFILLPAAFLYKPKDATEKALKFTMAGIYIFFLLSSFRGKVEANWTSPVLVSLIVLSHQCLIEKAKWQRIIFRLLPITLLLVMIARIIMIIDILPLKAVREKFHSWKEWPSEMREKTSGLPIVFSNSYQRASKYWFYSGQTTYSQNWYRERINNYNYWPIEDSLLGKPVYFLDKFMLSRFPDSLKTPIGWVGYRYDSLFMSFAKIKVQVSAATIKVKQNDTLILNCHFDMPEQYAAFIRSHTILSDTIRIGIFQKTKWLGDFDTGLSLKEIAEERNTTFRIPQSLAKGEYYLRFNIVSGRGNPTHNSEKIRLIIE